MRKAFTLVELIVVIGVISILATAVAMISISGNLQKARDTERKTEIEAIRSGLEIYRSQYKAYPIDDSLGSVGPFISGGLPTDPLAGRSYTYNAFPASCTTGCSSYVLCASMEVVSNASGTVTDCVSCGTSACNYAVTQ